MNNMSRSHEISELILKHPGKTWTLQAVAREFGVSVSTVRRWLYREGTSIKTLVKDVRRKIAEERLKDSGVSIGELACELGFNDASNFSTSFKRWFGVSPTRFRYATVDIKKESV